MNCKHASSHFYSQLLKDGLGARAKRASSWLTFSIAMALSFSLATMAYAEERHFDVSDFNGVSVSHGIHVHVTMGENFEVVAESNDTQQLERLELDVQRDTLRVWMDKTSLSLVRNEGWKVTVRVTMPSLIQADASSGAELAADAMKGTALGLRASSGATILVETIDGGTITADVSSGAIFTVTEGTCETLSADISGGSSIDMAHVDCTDVAVDASSGSHAMVNAVSSINADASSGARIRVFGTFESKEFATSTGGAIDFP